MLYTIRAQEGRGRCLIASRGIKQGEVIVEEEPFSMIVSDPLRDHVCAFCGTLCSAGTMYVLNPDDTVKYCSEHCITVDYGIHSMEVDALKLLKTIPTSGMVNIDSIRLVIRCGCVRKAILEKKVAGLSSSFENIMSLEALDRSLDAASVAAIDAVVDKLEKVCKIRKIPLVFAEIKSIILAIQCNAHRVLIDNRPIALGLFPLISMINHSCIPNCTHYFELSPASSRPKMIIRAIADIPEGEEVVYSYVPLYQSTANRLAQLRAAYSFECTCAKCTTSSASEEGISYAVGSAQEASLGTLRSWLESAPGVDSSSTSSELNEAAEFMQKIASEVVSVVHDKGISSANQFLLQSYVVIGKLCLVLTASTNTQLSLDEFLYTGIIASLLALSCIYKHIGTVEYETVAVEVILVKLLDILLKRQKNDGMEASALAVEQIVLEDSLASPSIASSIVQQLINHIDLFRDFPTVVELMISAVEKIFDRFASLGHKPGSEMKLFCTAVYTVANHHCQACRGTDVEL